MKNAEKIFTASLASVNPEILVKGYADKIMSYYSMRNFKKLIVTGFGKAAYQMARALDESLEKGIITEGVIVTKYGHAEKQRSGLENIKVYEAAHPVPDENGARAAEEIVRLLRSADESTLVVCLVSGGGSALLVSPYDGITLGEKQKITDMLLKCGADITELNAVRKHLSAVKGGRLAEIAYPAEVISLMISDVIGDRLDVIASGPTAPDSSEFQDALDVINKYGIADEVPENVLDVINRGVRGEIEDTPDRHNQAFQKVQNIIIGSNVIALEAGQRAAESLGYETEILSANVEGDVGDIGKWLAETAIKQRDALRMSGNGKKTCFISGGETTVVVKGKGKGGRNTELALRFAMEIDKIEGITMVSAGTDGTDGPTDAAGAIVDGRTITKAKALGLDPQEYLNNNDSYIFFKKIDLLIITGPTGTNVMDVHVVTIQ
jgi:glycerate-2-kinase